MPQSRVFILSTPAAVAGHFSFRQLLLRPRSTHLLCLAACAVGCCCCCCCWSSNHPNRLYLAKAFCRWALNCWQWIDFHFVDASNVSSSVNSTVIDCRPIVVQLSMPADFRVYYRSDWPNHSVGCVDVAVVQRPLSWVSAVFGCDCMCHRSSIAVDSVYDCCSPPARSKIFPKFEFG